MQNWHVNTYGYGVKVPIRRRYNCKNEDGNGFTKELENIILIIRLIPNKHDNMKKEKLSSRKHNHVLVVEVAGMNKNLYENI